MQRPIFLLAALGSVILSAGAQARDGAELRLVKALFAEVQPLSIRKNREYCGYIGLTAEGTLKATQPKRGGKYGCRPGDPVELAVVTASYHSHGAFVSGYASETPSVDDMEADESEGIDGWVATPGGRLWYIDTTEMVAAQVCGLHCLPWDAKFDPEDMGPVAESYSYDALVTYFDE
ncbi:DUF4329 domain-containing protein [Celeribacter persicus]|uniref:Uncharacterized protein DUF4329 n=1 Tax=Celeribacter persicus TaxID=1651082 RepID=A0A2T5HGQ5_9RHOB|nr:DUF4329 domain-containing protein [Celeribacter persicus]PTQ70736.1 uncharacterized protein DUF4329 [Celeribacter persicus]